MGLSTVDFLRKPFSEDALFAAIQAAPGAMLGVFQLVECLCLLQRERIASSIAALSSGVG
jgi:hypothetical protein